jgi:methionyl aminopeptidase
MAIIIKTPEEIEIMRQGGKILSQTLKKVCKMAQPGVSTLELDQFAEEFIRSQGASPTFKGYHGFPNTLCTCLNEKVVHCIPSKNEILKEGDLFTVDCGVTYQGLCTDAARSIPIGQISTEKQLLIETANKALKTAISLIKPGLRLNKIGETIEEIAEKAGFHIIRELTGHGVGKSLHEDPVILNHADNSPSPTLKSGMTLAIEPIFAIGTSKIITLSDHWTIVTEDRSCSVQAENTILVTETSYEILTNQ